MLVTLKCLWTLVLYFFDRDKITSTFVSTRVVTTVILYDYVCLLGVQVVVSVSCYLCMTTWLWSYQSDWVLDNNVLTVSISQRFAIFVDFVVLDLVYIIELVWVLVSLLPCVRLGYCVSWTVLAGVTRSQDFYSILSCSIVISASFADPHFIHPSHRHSTSSLYTGLGTAWL